MGFDAFNHAVQLVNDYWTRKDICPGFITSDEVKAAVLHIANLHFSINKFLYRINENIDSLMIVLAFSIILIAI